MTFTTSLKEEICTNQVTNIDSRFELSAIFRYLAIIETNVITITLENAAVARRIYKEIKMFFDISASITIRNQRRFRVKQIYIITINKKIDYIYPPKWKI